MIPHYHINFFCSDEDDCWIAHAPNLRGVSAHGEAPEEATRELAVAIAAAVEVLREHGEVIPEPRYRPAIYAVRDAA